MKPDPNRIDPPPRLELSVPERSDGIYNKLVYPNPLNLPRESVPPVYLMLFRDRDWLLRRD